MAGGSSASKVVRSLSPGHRSFDSDAVQCRCSGFVRLSIDIGRAAAIQAGIVRSIDDWQVKVRLRREIRRIPVLSANDPGRKHGGTDGAGSRRAEPHAAGVEEHCGSHGV